MSLSTGPVLLRSEAILSVLGFVQKLIKSPNLYKLNNLKLIHSHNQTRPSTNSLTLKLNPSFTASFNHNLKFTSTITITHFNLSSFIQLHSRESPRESPETKNRSKTTFMNS